MSAPRPLVIAIDDGVVGGLLRDAEARHRGTLVFGHGAGAGMRHRNMEAIAEAVAGAGLATLRFNFPYMEAGKSRVDGKQVATATIERALAAARAVRTALICSAATASAVAWRRTPWSTTPWRRRA